MLASQDQYTSRSECLLFHAIRLAILEWEAARILVEPGPLADPAFIASEHNTPEPKACHDRTAEAASGIGSLTSPVVAAVAIEGDRGVVEGRY